MSQTSKPDAPRERASGGPAKTAPDIASFVLRFTQDAWEEPSRGRHVRWRGHIRHIQGETETHFTDFADAVAFMQAELARLTLASVADAPEPDQASLLRESLHIWERFASDYAEAMSGAVKEGLGQSERYQRQALDLFQKTLGAWNPLAGTKAEPAPPAPDLAASLAAIQSQLDALSQAVERLSREEPPRPPER